MKNISHEGSAGFNGYIISGFFVTALQLSDFNVTYLGSMVKTTLYYCSLRNLLISFNCSLNFPTITKYNSCLGAS